MKKIGRRSPGTCVNVCNGWMRNDGICTGCGRNMEQVRDWNSYSAERKREEQQKIIASSNNKY